MLRRSVFLLSATALLGIAMPSAAQAQWTAYLGGGATFPTGDYGDAAKTGWMATGGVLYDIGTSGLGFGVEAFYSQLDTVGRAGRSARAERPAFQHPH